MRIISGKNKGLNLVPIKGDWIRPTSDKIRGAIFSSINSLLVEDEVFVDCFAGSGAMSIEALSRGFKEAYLFDNNKKSIQIIKANLEKAKISSDAHVIYGNALNGLKYLKEHQIKASFIFMDPPYKKIDIVDELFDFIYKNSLLSPEGIIMLEHDKNDIMKQAIDNFEIIKEKNYGNTTITTFKYE